MAYDQQRVKPFWPSHSPQRGHWQRVRSAADVDTIAHWAPPRPRPRCAFSAHISEQALARARAWQTHPSQARISSCVRPERKPHTVRSVPAPQGDAAFGPQRRPLSWDDRTKQARATGSRPGLFPTRSLVPQASPQESTARRPVHSWPTRAPLAAPRIRSLLS